MTVAHRRTHKRESAKWTWKRFAAIVAAVGAAATGLAAFIKNSAEIKEFVFGKHPELTAQVVTVRRQEIRVRVENRGSAPTRLTDATATMTSNGYAEAPLQMQVPEGAVSTIEPLRPAIDIPLQATLGTTAMFLPRLPPPCSITIDLHFTEGKVGQLKCTCPTS